MIVGMKRQQQHAIVGLVAAGVLWGLTVPLSKLSLAWLSPGWLTAVRFTIAALVLGWVARRELRAALTPSVLATGAVGFGGVVMLQNAGIQRTSVSAAAVVIGTVPVLVAVMSAATGTTRIGGRRWLGNAVALGGLSMVAGVSGGGSGIGDGLVFASSVLSAVFVTLQPRLLEDRDPAAVTAVQFAAAAAVAIPIALATGAAPAAAPGLPTMIAVLALALAGTVLPFWLFAAGQARVRPEVAGTFLNLEPLVGAAVGWIGFGEHAGFVQLLGMVAVLSGIALGSLSGGNPQGHAMPGRIVAADAESSTATSEPMAACRGRRGGSNARPDPAFHPAVASALPGFVGVRRRRRAARGRSRLRDLCE